MLIADDLTVLVSYDDLDTEFDYNIELNDNLYAPISQGQKIGTIKYNIDGVEYTSDLLASHNVEKSQFLTLIIQIIMIILILFFLYKLLFSSNHKRKHSRKKYKKIVRIK